MADDSRPARRENPGVGTRAVVTAIAVLFSLVLISMATVAALLDLSTAHIADPQLSNPNFPTPELQIAPSTDLATMRQRDHERLHEAAAIPIERAMEVIARRGTDAYAPLAPTAEPEQPP